MSLRGFPLFDPLQCLIPAWKCALGCSARATVVVHILFYNLSGNLCTEIFQIGAIVIVLLLFCVHYVYDRCS